MSAELEHIWSRVQAELALARGGNSRLDAHVAALTVALADANSGEAGARRLAVFSGLVAAILLPAFTISGRLPDIRIEQLLLPYAVFVLWIDHPSPAI